MIIKKKLILSVTIITIIILISVSYAGLRASQLGNSYKENVQDVKKNDKVLATVNNENITQSEVSYLQWQYDNSPSDMKPFSETENNIGSIIKKIAIDKLMLDEALKYNISLSEDERQKIKNNVNDSFYKNVEENQAFIENSGATKDEIAESIATNQINAKIISKLISKIITLINSNEFQTTDNVLRSAIDDYRNKKIDALQVMSAYKDSLYSNAKIVMK